MIIFYVKIGGAKNIKIEHYKIYSEYDSLKSTFCILATNRIGSEIQTSHFSLLTLAMKRLSSPLCSFEEFSVAY